MMPYVQHVVKLLFLVVWVISVSFSLPDIFSFELTANECRLCIWGLARRYFSVDFVCMDKLVLNK